MGSLILRWQNENLIPFLGFWVNENSDNCTSESNLRTLWHRQRSSSPTINICECSEKAWIHTGILKKSNSTVSSSLRRISSTDDLFGMLETRV